MNLKFKPVGYSSPEMKTRAKNLCGYILHQLAESNMPAVADLDSNKHYRITLTVANEPYNVMEIHEVFERRHPTGLFKFRYSRIYVGKIHNCVCRMYEQTEMAKKYSVVKVVSVLRDRYQAIESARASDRLSKDTESSRKLLVANLRLDFRRFEQYIQESPTTDVELRFRVDDSTARHLLTMLALGGFSK